MVVARAIVVMEVCGGLKLIGSGIWFMGLVFRPERCVLASGSLLGLGTTGLMRPLGP